MNEAARETVKSSPEYRLNVAAVGQDGREEFGVGTEADTELVLL